MHLVAIHGYPLDRRVFGPLTDVFRRRLVARSLGVYAPDLRGRGNSRREADTAHLMTLFADDLAEDVTVLVPDNEKFLLCGLSMGGYVAFEFLKRHKRRFQDRLAGLVLIGTRAGTDDPAQKDARFEAAAVIREQGMGPEVDRLTPKLLGRDAQDTELEELVRRMGVETPPETACADLLGMAERDDAFAVLAAFNKPVLVVHGEEDALVDVREAEATAEAAIGAPFVKLLTVPRAGHLVPLEKPLEVAEGIVELLKRN